MIDAVPHPPPVILLPDLASRWSVPAGWHVHDGFSVPDQPWDLTTRHLICQGTITDETEAVAAVTALTRGVGLAVSLTVTGDLRFRLLEDLHQLASVTEAAPTEDDGLDDDHQRLIGLLVDGATVTEAARQLNMSRRTAGRRLIEIRAVLGVDSTAEAISWWVERH